MRKLIPFLLILLAFGWTGIMAGQRFDDLEKLVKSGADEEVLMAYIASSPVSFKLTVDEIMQLKTLGASSKVISEAINHQAPDQNTPAPAASAPAASAVPADSSKAKTTVIYKVVPADGGDWVWVNDYWYWRRPSGVIVDLGWWPEFDFGFGWYGPRYWGGHGWGHSYGGHGGGAGFNRGHGGGFGHGHGNHRR